MTRNHDHRRVFGVKGNWPSSIWGYGATQVSGKNAVMGLVVQSLAKGT
jgi:hypothetical protein